MQNSFGCEINASASSNFCFARMCAGIGGTTEMRVIRLWMCRQTQRGNHKQCQRAERPPQPFPAVRNFDRRLDVADVVGDRAALLNLSRLCKIIRAASVFPAFQKICRASRRRLRPCAIESNQFPTNEIALPDFAEQFLLSQRERVAAALRLPVLTSKISPVSASSKIKRPSSAVPVRAGP